MDRQKWNFTNYASDLSLYASSFKRFYIDGRSSKSNNSNNNRRAEKAFTEGATSISLLSRSEVRELNYGAICLTCG